MRLDQTNCVCACLFIYIYIYAQHRYIHTPINIIKTVYVCRSLLILCNFFRYYLSYGLSDTIYCQWRSIYDVFRMAYMGRKANKCFNIKKAKLHSRQLMRCTILTDMVTIISDTIIKAANLWATKDVFLYVSFRKSTNSKSLCSVTTSKLVVTIVA